LLAAIGLNQLTHTYPEGISYYHLGANFMMAAVAIGSFFTIPFAPLLFAGRFEHSAGFSYH
jgi:hypothetical protein